MRIRLSDLAPGVNYAIQIRETDGSRFSDWSRIFNLTTTSDTVAPNTPTSVTGSMTGTSFNLSWAAVTTSSDGTAAHDLDYYEVKVESSGTGTTANYVVKTDTKFQFTFEMNRQLFGTPRAQIAMSVRAVDLTGNASAFSSPVVSQTNAAPANVTGLSGSASVDTITLKWTANTDADLVGYEVHRSKTGAAGTYTKIWSGTGTQYADATIDYFTDHWYRVYAVDVFGTLSATPAQTGAALRPVGSFTLDTTAPATPTGLAATLSNSIDGKSASAAVSWSANGESDLAEYVIGYKPSSAGDWQYTSVDYSLTSTLINNLLPYTNYDFRIRAADWQNNFSAWSSTLTKTATTNSAPATVTGVSVVPGKDSITVSWSANTEPDVANGAGTYMVDIATNSGFTTGLISYKTGAESITVTGLAQGTIYYARVKAVDSLGLASAAWSTTASGTTGTLNNFKYTISSTAPSSPSTGDIWMDTTTDFEKQWNGSAWVNTGNVTIDYMAAKGTDLVTNGSGIMGNNYNFSLYFDYNGADAPTGASGSFVVKTTSQQGASIEELISFDPAKKYKYSFQARQTVAGQTNTLYGWIAPFNAAGQNIQPYNYMFHPNTTTTLAADLVNGATTVQLTDASNWYGTAGKPAGGLPHYRSMIIWNYTDAAGKVWPVGTYSMRHWASNQWADGGITGNTITLNAPWAGGTITAGTPVSNGSSGGSYIYMPSATNTVVPETWTTYSDTFSAGALGTATAADGRTSAATWATGVPPGTAKIKVGWLLNYPSGGTGKHAVAAVSLSDAAAAYDLAYASSTGKNKIIHSTSPASGTTGYIAGDTWFQYNGSNNIIGQWRFSGTAWVSEKVDSLVIANLDAGLFTAGTAFITTLNIGSGGSIQSAGYTSGGTTGFSLGNTGLVIKGSNNSVDVAAVTAGTISAKTWNVGTDGIINIDSTGKIKSNNYAANSTGYQLSNTGLEINDGSIDAKALRTNTAVIGDLTIGRSADALGSLKSFGYAAGSTGFKLDKTGLEINDGSILAKTLKLQNGHNMMPPEYADFEYGDYYYINSFWNSRGQGNLSISGGLANANTETNIYTVPFRGTRSLGMTSLGATNSITAWLGKSSTDYNIVVEPSGKYILSGYFKNVENATSDWEMVVKGNNAAIISTTALTLGGGVQQTGWTRYETVVTIPASGVTKVLVGFQNTNTTKAKDLHVDAMQFEPVVAGLQTASVWKPPGTTTLDGSGITTGYMRSNANVNVSGIDLPAWSLSKDGSMQVGDALIRGKLVVGTTSEAPVNRAPNNGDFETNATGYDVYAVGGSGWTISRTTTAGEIITGTGSLKVTAAAGTKTALGVLFGTAYPYNAGTRMSVSAKVKVNATVAGSTLTVYTLDASLNVLSQQDIISNPVANTVYDVLYNYTLEASQTAANVVIAHVGTGLTTTSFIADEITLIDDVFVGNSYVSSPDYTSGATGWRIMGDGSVEFNNGTFRGQLGANMVDADQMVSEIIMSSKFKTAASGRRVEFDESGISMYENDESLLVNLPTDTDSPAMFNGDLLATSLTISDEMAIRGTNNELSKGATLTLSSGTTEPSSPPTVQIGYEQVDIGTDATWAPYRRGLAYSATMNRYIMVQDVYGGNAFLAYYNPSTGVQDWTTTSLKDIRVEGNAHVWGGEIYIVGKDINGAWKVEVRNETTKAWVRTWSVNNGYAYRPAIFNDGTNICILFGANSDHKVYVDKFNKTTGAFVSRLTSDHTMSGGNYNISSAGYVAAGVSGGFAGARIWWTRDNLKTIWVADSALQSLSASTLGESFTSPNNIRGAVFADTGTGNIFHTYDHASGKITKHTAISWQGTSTSFSKWWVGTTWYDPTGTTHETMVGKPVSFTMTKRAALTITAPPIPVRPIPNTDDDVRQAGIYMARGSATPTALKWERQGYTANESRTYYISRNGGAAPVLPTAGADAATPSPTSNTFIGLTGVSPALIRSNDDRIQLKGDGTFVLGDAVLDSSTFSNGLYVVHTPRQYTVSLSTGWGNYGNGYGSIRFYRTADGAWIGTGLLERTGTAVNVTTSGVTVGTIPSWNGTVTQMSAQVATKNTTKNFSFQVANDGTLSLRTQHTQTISVATGDWFSLNGVVFHSQAN